MFRVRIRKAEQPEATATKQIERDAEMFLERQLISLEARYSSVSSSGEFAANTFFGQRRS